MRAPDAPVSETVKIMMARARSFLDRHPSDPAVSRTFGYFTTHPVAPLNRRRLALILEELERISHRLERPLRVLDLACGAGLITCAIGSRGHRALGLDLDADEIRLARAFAQEEKQDAMFAQADLLGDPGWERMAEESLGGRPDAVTLAYALHHLPGVEKFVERLGAWLPAGAALLVNEENPLSPLFRLKHRVRGWIQKDTDVEWHRSFPDWSRLLEAHGFRVTASPVGADPLPALDRLWPEKCWSLVFLAQREMPAAAGIQAHSTPA
jgi:SAM-dependent methyltransferase